jgi:hypothetical protein
MAYVEHGGKRRDLGRVVGGIGWPGEKPGYAVIVGEELYPRSGERDRRIHLLEEIVDVSHFGELLTRCAELARAFKVQRNVTVKGFYARMDEISRDQYFAWRERNREDLFVTRAPNSQDDGSIRFFIDLLNDRASQGNLHLTLSERFQTKGRLTEVQETDISTAKDSQYPAVAALGYAVVYLAHFLPEEEEEDEDRHTYEDKGQSKWTGY